VKQILWSGLNFRVHSTWPEWPSQSYENYSKGLIWRGLLSRVHIIWRVRAHSDDVNWLSHYTWSELIKRFIWCELVTWWAISSDVNSLNWLRLFHLMWSDRTVTSDVNSRAYDSHLDSLGDFTWGKLKWRFRLIWIGHSCSSDVHWLSDCIRSQPIGWFHLKWTHEIIWWNMNWLIWPIPFIWCELLGRAGLMWLSSISFISCELRELIEWSDLMWTAPAYSSDANCSGMWQMMLSDWMVWSDANWWNDVVRGSGNGLGAFRWYVQLGRVIWWELKGWGVFIWCELGQLFHTIWLDDVVSFDVNWFSGFLWCQLFELITSVLHNSLVRFVPSPWSNTTHSRVDESLTSLSRDGSVIENSCSSESVQDWIYEHQYEAMAILVDFHDSNWVPITKSGEIRDSTMVFYSCLGHGASPDSTSSVECEFQKNLERNRVSLGNRNKETYLRFGMIFYRLRNCLGIVVPTFSR
jgi:hypothetical protein